MTLWYGLGGLAAVALAFHGWHLVRTPTVGVMGFDGLELKEKKEQKSLVAALLRFLDRVVGGRVLGQVGPETRRKLRHQILRAGSPDNLTVEGLVRRQASWAFLTGCLAFLLLSKGQFWAALLPVIGWYLPRISLFMRGRNRSQLIERELPDFLDVMSVTISAGLGFRSALRRVATLLEGPVAEEMLVALRQIDLGASRRQAFTEMRDRSGSLSLNNFITAFLQAEELGTPITGFLEAYSKEIRRTAGQRARTAAARANPKISMILTLVIMPAITIFLLGSIIMMAMSS